MSYSPEVIVQLNREVLDVLARLQTAFMELAAGAESILTHARAREFAKHGLARRLGILRRCIENIYAVFPPERSEILERSELVDVDINLHAFVTNVGGAQDNIAWVYVLEYDLEERIGNRNRIGLFKRETQRHLPNEVREYLNSPRIQTWYAQHARDYRDALAHRIPLYVPPFQILNSNAERYEQLEREAQAHLLAGDPEAAASSEAERDALATPCACFIHSLSEEDPSQRTALHPQLIADARTVLEVMGLVFRHLRSAA